VNNKKGESSLYLGIILMIVTGVITLLNFTSDPSLYLVDINYAFVFIFLVIGIALVVRYILKNK